jgi:hypothetical protein
MQAIRTIGLDIAKSVFQVHCIDAKGCPPPPAEAPVRGGFVPEAAGLSDQHRSLRLVALLAARAPGARPPCSAQAASLCEALCQTAEERCYRRGGQSARL